MSTLTSILPLLSVILALLLKQSALRAACLGILATLPGIAFHFPIPTVAILPAVLRWTPIILEVLLIIGGGLWLAQTLQHSGAQADLARWIDARVGRGVGSVLLIVHGITPFAESLTGFGIGITIGIPLLVHSGLPPHKAAFAGLLGLCTVPWGSMGPGTLIAANMAGLTFYDLGLASALYNPVAAIVSGICAAFLAATPGERGKAIFYGSASGLLLSIAIYLANRYFGTAPAGALGAACLCAFYLNLRGRGRGSLTPLARRALQSYALLLGGVLTAGLLAKALAPGWRYLASPGLWLLIATLWYGQESNVPRRHAWQAWQRVAPVTGLYILLGIMMALSGMATHLAQTLAESNRTYLALGPIVAAAGGFITGSTSGANAMLATTQAEIARTLDVNVLAFLAIHNVAAAWLMMASPSKVELARQLAASDSKMPALQRDTLLAGTVVTAVLACCALNL